MNRFTLTNVTTPDAAIAALRLGGDAPVTYDRLNEKRPLGGGSDLLGEIKEGLISPRELVNLAPVADWHGIRPALDGTIEIGATTFIADVASSADVRRGAAALADAAEHVGSPQIRNQGTVGGNVCQRPRCWYYRHADTPCLKRGGSTCFAQQGEDKYLAIFGNDAPCVMISGTNLGVALLALDGRIHVYGEEGERIVQAADFYRMPTAEDPYRETNLAPGEVVCAISVDAPEKRRSAYMQLSEKADFDWALVSAATSLTLDDSGAISDIRLALNAVAPLPWRLTAAEDFLRGKKPDASVLREAAHIAVSGARPLRHNGYKVALARTLVSRVITRALA